MKRVLLPILALLCMLNFCLHASASEDSLQVVTIHNVDIIFEENSTLSDEEKQTIALLLISEESGSQTYGLICNVFGHKNSTEIVTTITHCVNDANPRCLQERWEVVTCSRCGNTETTRIAYSLISCCPVD